MIERRPNTSEILPYEDYDLVIVAFSGGKDSLAALLHLIDDGCPREKIQLWHHEIDGVGGERFMDWPITASYCQAVGDALGVRVLFNGKDGGFKREMLRDGAVSAGVTMEAQDGSTLHLDPSPQAKPGTRMQFPQVSADLSVRWCSAYLKIDVICRVIANDPALKTATILQVTGERREESPNRSRYAEVERHKTTTKKRRVDHWRAIIDWTEQDVWNVIENYGIDPHPAYKLGWSRVSCMSCIFAGADQWASIRSIAPETFATIADFERSFGRTIHRSKSVEELADDGTVYDMDQDTVDEAVSESYVGTIRRGISWELPSGAYGDCGGPS